MIPTLTSRKTIMQVTTRSSTTPRPSRRRKKRQWNKDPAARARRASSPCPGTWRPSKHPPPEKPRKKKPRRLLDGGPTAAHVNALLDKDAQLTCQQQNPKRGESALRYDKYKAATSAKQLLALGASSGFKNDLAKGYVTLKKSPLAGLVITPAVRTSKRCGVCEMHGRRVRARASTAWI